MIKKEKNDKNQVFFQYLTPTLFGASVIVVTLITNYFFVSKDLKIWLVSLAFIILLSVFFMILFFIYLKQITFDVLVDVKEEIRSHFDKNLIDWLKTPEQLIEIENSKDVNEVWIVSLDLTDDVENGKFYQTIKRNIRRGIKYRYFVPETDFEATKILFNSFESEKNKGNISIGSLSNDYFRFMPKLDFVIYNPEQKQKTNRYGFMCLPHTIDKKIWYQEITNNRNLIDITSLLKATRTLDLFTIQESS